MDLVMSVCDRLVVLNFGQVIAHGTPGAVTAVLGANGAGKTTLLRTISGLVKPKDGSVLFEGQPLLGRPVEAIVRLGVSHVPEGRGVIEELTVEENLRLATLWRLHRDERQNAIAETFDLFPRLQRFRRQRASTLSGGERQMLVVGRALISRPQLLLLDEPSLGLAPMVTAQLMELIRDRTEGTDLTVVLVEQNARSALSVSHHAVILNLGQVVVSDAAASVAADEQLRHHYLGF
jgi:branched-chain amino acid transport system ATP-binding protein